MPVVDLNKDGRPDFLALVSQHHETVVAFLNRGKGQFERRELFTAPHPHWGFRELPALSPPTTPRRWTWTRTGKWICSWLTWAK